MPIIRSVPDPSETPGGSARARTALARVYLALVVVSLALALVALPQRVGYLTRLARAGNALERGALAADERVAPDATAGQVRWRASLAEAPAGAAPRSGLALAWRFFAARCAGARAGNRYYLARPNDALYMYGNFLCAPARLEVAPPPVPPLVLGSDLAGASARRACGELEWLRERGYAGCIEVRDGGLRLESVDGSVP
jgi:hypothetical protein